MYSIRPSHCNFVNVEPLNVFIFICLMGTRRYFRRSGRAFHHHSSAGNSPSRWQSPLVWVEWRLPRNDSSGDSIKIPAHIHKMNAHSAQPFCVEEAIGSPMGLQYLNFQFSYNFVALTANTVRRLNVETCF